MYQSGQMGHNHPQMGIYPKQVAMQGPAEASRAGRYSRALRGLSGGQPQMGIYPKQVAMQGEPQMGSFLSDLIGVDLKLDSAGQALITGGTEGAKQQIASQIVGNKDVQTLAYQASQKTLADKVAFFLVKNQKVIGSVVVAGAAFWVFNKFVLKKSRA